MNELFIYIRQRFNLLRFSALALLLIFISGYELNSIGDFIFQFAFVLLFLLCMRLYDDLWNAEIDKDKPERIYTDASVRPKLKMATAVLMLICILSQIIHLQNLIYLISFFIINHSLYFLFFKNEKIRFVLPHLKYPFICFLMSSNAILTAPLILVVMLVFDLYNDKKAPFNKYLIYPLSILSFILLYFMNTEHTPLFSAIGLLISIVIFYQKIRYAEYIYLAMILGIAIQQTYL